MIEHVVAYAATAMAFFALDFLWLSRLAKSFYAGRLGSLLLEKPRLSAAIAFYAIYVLGIVIFAVAPALNLDSPQHALVMGALFGFFAYATYDMTNFATLKGWPLSVVIVDIGWGIVLTGLSAFLGFHGAHIAMPAG